MHNATPAIADSIANRKAAGRLPAYAVIDYSHMPDRQHLTRATVALTLHDGEEKMAEHAPRCFPYWFQVAGP
ncbi:hypothetical protein D3878_14950 [Noviherbaspirillum sedimenti]|uniref:Uncharacterized protein n=1 Tax=Noviherbaspirillum sedimenti TaxID=2320865 RepID=A0A3A3G4W4_9BURK|nr:hypothetical protein D3878_14950 [Noviherbaspirillum sedimenti]